MSTYDGQAIPISLSTSFADKTARDAMARGFGSGGATTTRWYKLRASCTTAPGGYVEWMNTTGDNSFRPACGGGGTLGETIIVDTWDA